MAFNVLSGSITAHDLVATGSFSGSYVGDGQGLNKVLSITNNTTNQGDRRVVFYNQNGSDFSLDANSSFTFGSDGVLNIPNTTASAGLNLPSISAGTATTSSFLALDSNNNVVLTSSAGGGGGSGGSIGAAEDGDYTDGLFTDFTISTPVGTPIDRFNEVLKILAPSPAPSLSSINEDVTDGITAKLSFGSSSPVTDYTSSATAAGFDAVDVNGTYQAETSGSNIRLGVYDGSQDITGFLNYNIDESVTNGYISYSNDAFGSANEGTLNLELNGDVVHTVDLSALVGSGNPNSGSANSLTGDSGFTSVSVIASSFDGNGSEWYIFKHRTAKYKIDANDQKVGWNYLRIIHTIGSTNYTTNYVEWINDPSGAVDDLSISNPRIENIALIGSKFLSGVEYNTDATAEYRADINNLYRNVYAAAGTPISFTTSNSATPTSQAVPAIGGGEDNTKILGITGSLDCNVNSLLNGAITANITVTHPLKATISNTGSATTGNGFLIDNRTLASTNTSEKFHDEAYRKTSGSYDTQASTIAAASVWNSENHMTGGGAAGHTDGLLFYNQRLYSPVDADIPNTGDFSALTNIQAGEPDYSGVSGNRTFYRILSNSSGVDLFNFSIESSKVGTTYNNSALGTGNVHFFVKIPETTGWMDISQNFQYGSIEDDDGAKVAAASDSDTNVVTFGTASVTNGDRMMLKVVADASWQGYISQLDFTLPANQSQATPQVLSDIDANDAGSTAKLSFGSSNSVAGYSSATGSSISLTDYDTNAEYSYGGAESNRRGIFNAATIIDGTLNDAIGGGSGYPADAFFNGYSGSLVLEVNGTEVHSVSLDTLSAISNDFNGNSSGFDLSAVDFSTLSNIPHYTKPYRTGTYQIGTADQNDGWNYARVIHRTSGDQTTNYIEWIVDPSGSTDDTAVSAPTLANFNHLDVYYQSGIGYFASRPSASFEYNASNFYRNVYYNGSDAITFGTTTNSSISNIRVAGAGITTFDSAVSQTSMPALNNTANCEEQVINVTGTVLFDSLTSISGGLSLFTDYDVSVASTVKHVSGFKSNRTTSTASKTSFMVYSGSIGSTNLNTNEYFNTEDYRIVSGNYANQAATTSSANTWNSTYSMNDAVTYPAYADGAVTVNGYMISPLQIGNDGDTRNAADGGSLQAPPSNPNYSSGGLTESTRTFYRYFQNNSGLAKATFTVTLYGDANLISKSGAFYTGTLGANNNIQVELKVPFDPAFTGLDDTSTAWGDCIKPYSAGTQPDVDGVGIFNGGGSDLDQTVGSGGRAIAIQLQGKQIRSNQYFVVKISAHKDWTGYLSRIQITY